MGRISYLENRSGNACKLLRTIEDIGMSNVGINFDTANFLLYGKANPWMPPKF